MNLSIFGLAAVGAVGALALSAAPGSAQPVPLSYDWGGHTLAQRESGLASRADRDRDDGWIDHAQYVRVTDELANVRQDENSLRDAEAGELTGGQAARLEARLDHVASQLNRMDGTM